MTMRERLEDRILGMDACTYEGCREIVDALLTELEKPSAGVIEDGNTEIENCIDSWNYESGSGYLVEQHAAHSCMKAMIQAIREGK